MSNENNNVASLQRVQNAVQNIGQTQIPHQSQSGENSKISDGQSAFALLLRGLQKTQQNSSYFANILANQHRATHNALNSFNFERAQPTAIERPAPTAEPTRNRERVQDNDRRYDVQSRDNDMDKRVSADDNNVNRFDDYARQQPKRSESSSQDKTTYTQKNDNKDTKLDNIKPEDTQAAQKLSPLEKNNEPKNQDNGNIIVAKPSVEAKTDQTSDDLPDEVKDIVAFLSAMHSKYADMTASTGQDQLLFDEAFLQTFHAQLTVLLQNANLLNNQHGLNGDTQLKALLGIDSNMLSESLYANMIQLLQQMQNGNGDVIIADVMDNINPSDLLKLMANQQNQASQIINVNHVLAQQPQEKLTDLIANLSLELRQYKASQTNGEQLNIDMITNNDGDIDVSLLDKLSQMKNNEANQKSDMKLNLNNNNPQQQKLAEILALTQGDGIKNYQLKTNAHDGLHGQQQKISDDILSQLDNIDLSELPQELLKARHEQLGTQTQNMQQSSRHSDMFASQDNAFANQDNPREQLSKALQSLLQGRGKDQGNKLANNDDNILHQLNNNLTTHQKAKTTNELTSSSQTQQVDNKATSVQPMQILSSDHKVSDDLKSNFAEQLAKKPQTSTQDTQKMNEQIAVKIKQAISQQQDVIQFRLNPASLGRVEVQMDLSRDGILTASIVVERSETLDLLKQDQKQLIDALTALGFDIENGGLEFGLDQSYNEGQGFKEFANQNNDDESLENNEEDDKKQIIDDDILPFGADVAFNDDGSFSVRV